MFASCAFLAIDTADSEAGVHAPSSLDILLAASSLSSVISARIFLSTLIPPSTALERSFSSKDNFTMHSQ